MVVTTAGAPATRVVSITSLRKLVPMIEQWSKTWPSAIWPRACMTASRAQVPVPQGERSSRPGDTTTVFLAVSRSPVRSTGPVNSVTVTSRISGFSGCTTGNCSTAAALIFWPTTQMSRASSGVMAKPQAPASTSANIMPP